MLFVCEELEDEGGRQSLFADDATVVTVVTAVVLLSPRV